MLGSEAAETNLRTLLLPCYLQLLGVDVGSETAETNLWTLLLPCYLQLLGVDVGERDCGDESADAAVTMLFAAVGGRCWGARHGGNESADGAVTMLFATVGVDLLCDTLAADDAGVRLLCDILLRTLLVGGCCCVIKGSKIWTPYFLHLNGCCCAIPCCGWCWARTFAARSAAADAAVCVRVLLRDMQEQIIRGLKSANKVSKIWTPYFLYVEGLFANRGFLPIAGWRLYWDMT